ncbi:hypothetical protein CTI12_AA172790 [Artemisia annua]|uniref:Uncharacterized protein n=1 Tax=Artemisia annua TaxID=35608 RepID=A0A2U1PAK5_ARTAN|nr:hypothetical protein CTI12_AA172790 [Artemisia annua]
MKRHPVNPGVANHTGLVFTNTFYQTHFLALTKSSISKTTMELSSQVIQPLALTVIHPEDAQQLQKADQMIYTIDEIMIKPNNFVANLNPTKNKEFFQDVLTFVEKCCIRKTFILKPSFRYESYLKEFWYTATVTESNTIKITVENGSTNLEFGVSSFREAIGANYLKDPQQYEANPDGKVTKTFFGNIGYSDKLTGTLRKTYLPPNWKLLMTLIIQCIGGNTGGFISLVMEFQMGASYRKSNFKAIETPTFSDDYFLVSQPIVVGATLTPHMMFVCASEISTDFIGIAASSESEDVQKEHISPESGICSQAILIISVCPVSSSQYSSSESELCSQAKLISSVCPVSSSQYSSSKSELCSQAKHISSFCPVSSSQHNISESVIMHSESEAIDKSVPIFATEYNVSICVPNYFLTFHQELELDSQVQSISKVCASSSSQHITTASQNQNSESEAIDNTVAIFASEDNINKCASIDSLVLHQDDPQAFDYPSVYDWSLEMSDQSMSDLDDIDSKELLCLLPSTIDHISIGKFANEDEPVMILDDYDVDESYPLPAHGGIHDDESKDSPAHGCNHDDESMQSPAHGGNNDDESYNSPAHGGKHVDESYWSQAHGGNRDDESYNSPPHGGNHDEDHVSAASPELSSDHPPSPKSQRISHLSNEVLNLQSKIEMLKKEKEFADQEIVVLKSRLSYPSVSDISSKILESLKPELGKLVTREDFNGKFSTDLNNLSGQQKEISCKVAELTQAVSKVKLELPKDMIDIPAINKGLSTIISELNKNVASIESKDFEVPSSLLGLPLKVGNLIDEVSKYKSLESIPLSLEKVENAIHALNACLKSSTSKPGAYTDVVMENMSKESGKQLKVSDLFTNFKVKQRETAMLKVAQSNQEMISPSNADTHDKNEVGKSMESVKVKDALIESQDSHEKVSGGQENDIIVHKEPLMDDELVEINFQQGDITVGKKPMNESNENVTVVQDNDVIVGKDALIEDHLVESEVQQIDGIFGKKPVNDSQLKNTLVQEPDGTINEGSLMFESSPVKEIKYTNLNGRDVHIAGESLTEQQRHLSRMYEENVKHEKLMKKAKMIKSLEPPVIDLFMKKKALYDKYCHIILNRRAPGKITNVDILSRKKGPATLKIYRDDGDEEIIEEFKVRDLHWEEWNEFLDCCGKRKAVCLVDIFNSMRKRVDEVIEMKNKLNIQDGVPLQDQDPIHELNRIARKRKRVDDDMEEYFRSTKRFKDQVAYEDHPPGTVLNEPMVGMIIFNNPSRKDFISIQKLGNLTNVMLYLVQTVFIRLHKGPGTTDIAKTFSEFVVREAEKRNKETPHKVLQFVNQGQIWASEVEKCT